MESNQIFHLQMPKIFAEGHLNWVKQGEAFMLQLLDKCIAVPVAVYYLTKASSHLDVQGRVLEVLKYASVCSNCLQIAKTSGFSPGCDSFSVECFQGKAICDNYQDVFKEWISERRPCDLCAHLLRNGLEFL